MERVIIWCPKAYRWTEAMKNHDAIISLAERGSIFRMSGNSYDFTPPTIQEGLLAVECVRTAQ